MVNIILCGGKGSRLWPISREHYPKQFCNFFGKYSLFQNTLLRNKNLAEKTIIVTNEEQYILARKQTDELKIKNVEYILEPVGRNTAPAITIACLTLNYDDIAFVTPCDHYIENEKNYCKSFKKAEQLAKKEYLVTFGIKPSFPETGFGYIEADNENVISFHEKPNKTKALKYMSAGNYFWNSGMFVFKSKTYLDEIKHYSKDIFDCSKKAFEKSKTKNKITKISKAYMEKIPDNSIDYAVMEKSKKIKMLPLDINWSDLGSFESIYKISTSDKNGNVSSKNNVFDNSKNNMVISGNKLITLIDINDLMVIDTPDATLICKKGSSQKIKKLLTQIESISPNITKK